MSDKNKTFWIAIAVLTLLVFAAPGFAEETSKGAGEVAGDIFKGIFDVVGAILGAVGELIAGIGDAFANIGKDK